MTNLLKVLRATTGVALSTLIESDAMLVKRLSQLIRISPGITARAAWWGCAATLRLVQPRESTSRNFWHSRSGRKFSCLCSFIPCDHLFE